MNVNLQEIRRFSFPDILFCLEPDGKQAIIYGSSDGGLHRLELEGEKPEPVAFSDGHASYVTGLCRVAGGDLVSCSYDRQLLWWNADGTRKRSVEGAHDKWIRTVVASPDGKILASVGDDMVARLWDGGSGALLKECRGHEATTPHHYPSMLFTCAFHPENGILATADKVGRICLWDVPSGKMLAELEAPIMYTWDPDRRRHSIGGVRSLAFSPDGRTLAAGGMGQVGNIDHLQGKMRVRLFDWERGETLAEVEGSQAKGLAEHLAFDPEGKWLLAQGGDNKGAVMLIDPATGEVLHEAVSSFHVHDFSLGQEGSPIIAVGHNALALQEVVVA